MGPYVPLHLYVNVQSSPQQDAGWKKREDHKAYLDQYPPEFFSGGRKIPSVASIDEIRALCIACLNEQRICNAARCNRENTSLKSRDSCSAHY